MSASKLVNKDEFIRWYNEGKSYSWIIDEYQRKYGITIGQGTVSNWRHQLGLEKRYVRSIELMPWYVEREHRTNYIRNMLHYESRRRSGGTVPPVQAEKLNRWLAYLEEQDAVVHYDPDTEQGWFLVPRRPGIDKDIIRVPDRVTRKRGSRE